LKQLRAAITCNISLHGGSGTPLEQFVEAVKIGVSKININSDMRYTYRVTLEEQLKGHPTEYALVKLMPPVIDAVATVVEEKITAFGSTGKASI
jgi:fructose-bisphosphate aldolase, class II